MGSYIKAMQDWSDFNSRSTRWEYWLFTLFLIILSFAASAVDGIVFGSWRIGPFNLIFSFVHLIPSLSVSVRRLHDIGKSGWWLLLLIVPVAGPLVILIFDLLPSQRGSNRYGSNPYGM